MPQRFPTKLLKALLSRAWGKPGDVSMEIPIQPFRLHEDQIETSLRLDGINLPSLAPQDLAGKRFEFPVNPHPGYVDGSIYIADAHHPVDVTVMAFEASANINRLTIQIEGVLVVEFEGLQYGSDAGENYSNSPLQLNAEVTFEHDV
jgi:hypothetical protein